MTENPLSFNIKKPIKNIDDEIIKDKISLINKICRIEEGVSLHS